MKDVIANQEFDSKEFLRNLTASPGVYRMHNEKSDVIYVGKAKNLKKRVSSYFTKSDLTPKTRVMVAQVRHIEITVTHTENEALILESNLIKSLRPQYNIVYRDDKSYPYIYLSADKHYPRLSYYRGSRKEKGRFFGPYPSSGAVRESLNLLQKLFPIRQCEDSFFSNRSRPCLQYQIKRCSAPCLDLITPEEYAEEVKHASMFLEGKNTEVIEDLATKMEGAAESLAYELAAKYRDQIAALSKIQERQYITSEGRKDIDVIAAATGGGIACVQVFYFRGGNNLGNKSFFPKQAKDRSIAELLAAFVAQHYVGKQTGHTIPTEIVFSEKPSDADLLQAVLSEQLGKKVVFSFNVRSERSRWLNLASTNAQNALDTHLANKANILSRFENLQDVLGLENMPLRIECFDISHTMGEATVASCVVCDTNGMLKSDYRRFNINDITPGDDYAAMHQALTRRYKRLQKGEGKLPDILLIDGAKGQLSQAEQVLEELQVTGVIMLGVAKGADRKPGMETLWLSGKQQPFILPTNSPALHLIQMVRDESHRFAIQGHRARRGKKRETSILEEIPGLGPKKRQILLRQFGGLQGVSSAGVEDLARIKGINKGLAQKIYDIFHQ